MDRQYNCEHFIRWALDRLGDSPRVRDNGAISRLKRAGSPDQAPQAWDILIRLGIPPKSFAPCLLVGGALCRRGEPSDGTASLGLALASCYDDREQGKLRLRRLLSCSGIEELCSVLRPLLGFVNARAKQKLCHARLLHEVLAFGSPATQERIKLLWAQDFWNVTEEGGE